MQSPSGTLQWLSPVTKLSLSCKSLASRNLAKSSIPGTNFAFSLAIPDVNCSLQKGRKNGGLHSDRIKSQERRPMMDLVYVLAIVGFFGLCIAYTHAFDRI